MPLVQTDVIASTLAANLYDKGLDLEVFTEFPTDEESTSEGLYVARFYQEDRKALSITLGTTGSTYNITDRLEMYLIEGQLNYNVDSFLNAISDFVDDAIFVNYFKREYTVEQLYRKNNESYRIIFSLTRLQILK
jgi:hypothetical protein